MSFFIQTALPTPMPFCESFIMPGAFSTSANPTVSPVPILKSLLVDSAPTNYFPILPDKVYANMRFFCVRVDPTDSTIFGMVTQYKGRKSWLCAVDTTPATSYLLRFWDGEFPPAGPHATKFKVSAAPRPNWCYITSHGTGKYLKADLNNDFSLVTSPDVFCQYKFHWNTSSGPVIPTPSTLAPIPSYVIISHYGKALSSATTAPYLSQATIDYDEPEQQFFYRSVKTPDSAASVKYTYNMYFGQQPDTMICFESNKTLGIRTTAGSWEELHLVSSDALAPGRFKIVSFALGTILRAKSDGTLEIVDDYNTTDPQVFNVGDYFSFVPVGSDIPPIGSQ